MSRAPGGSGRSPWSLQVLAAVALGGALGSSLRVALGTLGPGRDDAFPWTTLVINVVGCAALAALPGFRPVRDHELLAPMLGTGVLGGFTTLSTWSAETVTLASADRPDLAAGYALVTLVSCLGVVALVGRYAGTASASGEEVR